jgi:peptidoglycan/xylan/chitin deacetylase (PgdA/CDA1 family)
MLLIINYHYIRDAAESEYPGIYAITPDQLKGQLSIIGQAFEFIRPDELLASFLNGEKIDGKVCLVTFDDGLREQYEKALPILDSLGIVPLFHINGACIEEGIVNLVHKIHWLRAQLPSDRFAGLLQEALDAFHIKVPMPFDTFRPVEGQNIYDSIEIKYIKYLLNHVLRESDQRTVVNHLYRQYSADEGTHSRKLYMDAPMVSELMRRGMGASHGYLHNPKGLLTYQDMVRDFEKNQRWILKRGGERTPFVSYPYGGRNAVSHAVARAATKAGHLLGFTMERSLNLTLEHPLLLGRLDANDCLGGKKPLLRIEQGAIAAIPPATGGRTWFFDEQALSS